MKNFVLCILVTCFSLGCSSIRRSSEYDRKNPTIVVQNTGKKQPTAPGTGFLPPTVGSSSAEQKYNEILIAESRAGNYLGMLLGYDAAVTDPTVAQNHEKYKEKGLELIDSKLSLDDLDQFTEKARSTSLKSAAWYRMGELALDQHEFSDARKYFGRCMAILEEPSRSEKAKYILEQLENLRKVESKTVGVVLPLSGKQAAVSQKILRGIQLGLGFGSKVPTTFRLAVIDSEGSPDLARRGIEKLIKEDNVIAVIGGVISKTATAEAAIAADLGVPLITLTQKSGITEASPNIFRNSVTSEMQVRYLVKTAMEEMNLRKFAILFPNDPYGVEYANIFWDEVLARGGEIGSVQAYPPKETDFGHVIKRLIGTYYIEARFDEYRLRSHELQDNKKKESDRESTKDDVLPAVVEFDAVFIPDGAKAMGQISAMLAYNGVKGIRLLGTNLWNVQGLAKRAGPFANSVFVDSFLNTDERIANSPFVKNFKSVYSDDPGVFELQGYDSAAVLRQLITQGATNRESLSQALARLQDFPAALGELSMTEEREIMRPLVGLTLNNGNIVPFTRETTK